MKHRVSKREKLLSTFTISGSVLTNEAPDDTVRFCGKKRYEFTNHLGNVLLVTTDRKMSQDVNTDGTTDHFHCVIDAYYDYGPFGNVLDGRTAGNFRYKFNGTETDEEMYNNKASHDFGARMYNSDLGRWMSVDPYWKLLPMASPYCFVINSPIRYKDRGGNILAAANQASWTRLYEAVQKIVSADENLKNLFVRDGDKFQFKKIDESEFNDITKDLDPDLKALAKGYYETINAQEEYIVMVSKNSATLSAEDGFENLPIFDHDKSKFDKTTSEYLRQDPNDIYNFNRYNWKGIDGKNYSEIIIFSEEKLDETIWKDTEKSYWTSEGSLKSKTPSDPKIDLATTMLGIVITTHDKFVQGGDKGVPQNRGTYDGINNTEQYLKLSTQIENMIRRVTLPNIPPILLGTGKIGGITPELQDKDKASEPAGRPSFPGPGQK